MAVETIVTIELNNNRVIIPPEVYATLDTKISFRISGIRDYFVQNPFSGRFNRYSLELYFDNPEGLGLQRLYSTILPPQLLATTRPDTIVMATGTVNEKGKYKYGFRILTNGKRSYDEDPYVIVL